MKHLFDEYADALIAITVGFLILSSFLSAFLLNLLNTNIDSINMCSRVPTLIEDYETVSIDENRFVVKDAVIDLNEAFNYQEHVSAFNSIGEDISDFVILNTRNIDTSNEGEMDLRYTLYYNGEEYSSSAKLYVVDQRGISSDEESL
ncbi:MAG: hypothetical protein Q4B60_03530 [Erysipelotrichaceae bacterium]|nr:hypothetical protein [Erysipelotrichaceae bacterium]